MGTKQTVSWRNYVKNLLFVIFVLCVVALPQTLIFAWNGSKYGVMFSAVFVLIGTVCLFVAARWHNQDIHITAFGFWIGAVIFLLSPFIIWWFQLSIWPNIIISLYFLSKPAVLFFKEK